MRDVTGRKLMKTSVAAALGASVVGAASGDDSETAAPTVKGDLKRFSLTAFGAEATGPYVFEDGSFLYSLQHPSRDNPEPFDRAGIGYVSTWRTRSTSPTRNRCANWAGCASTVTAT